jgi:hypothetical protein
VQPISARSRGKQQAISRQKLNVHKIISHGLSLNSNIRVTIIGTKSSESFWLRMSGYDLLEITSKDQWNVKIKTKYAMGFQIKSIRPENRYGITEVGGRV